MNDRTQTLAYTDVARGGDRRDGGGNGGRNDGFVAWGDSGALVMGRYGETDKHLGLWQIAREFTLCDNFFMAACNKRGCRSGSIYGRLTAAAPPNQPDPPMTTGTSVVPTASMRRAPRPCMEKTRSVMTAPPSIPPRSRAK